MLPTCKRANLMRFVRLSSGWMNRSIAHYGQRRSDLNANSAVNMVREKESTQNFSTFQTAKTGKFRNDFRHIQFPTSMGFGRFRYLVDTCRFVNLFILFSDRVFY